MPDPILIDCEGSGCPTHASYTGHINGTGICAMCGETVPTNEGVALMHVRKDILAMLARGDFDA